MSEIVARSAQFGVLALAARHLTPAGFGIYGLAAAIHQVSLAIVQSGPELHATRLVAQNQSGQRLVMRVSGVKGGLAAVAYLAIVAVALGLYGDGALLRQSMAQGLVLAAVALSMVWVMKAKSRFGHFALARGGQSLLFLAAVAIALSRTSSPLALPLSELAATGAVAFLSLPYCVRLSGRDPVAAGSTVSRQPLLGPSLTLGFSSLCAEAIWAMPVTVGGLFLDAGAVGLVAGVNRTLTALNGVFQMLVQVFYPALARTYREDPDSGRDLAGRLMLLTGAGAVLLAIAGGILAEPFVRVLLGAGKVAAVPVLAVCIWALVPAFGGAIAGYALLAAGRNALYTGLVVGATALSALCAVLSYGIAPVPEAAAAQIAAQGLYMLLLFACVTRLRLIAFPSHSWSSLRPSAIRHLLSGH